MSQLPVYARRNNKGIYVWEGVEYRSVTTYLGYVTGKHIPLWYGKKASLDCALQLDLRDSGAITPEECDERIRDYGMRMRAGEVYRDFKASVGSIVHHLLYHRAIGDYEYSPDTAVEWLQREAMRMSLLARRDDDGGILEDASEGDYCSLALFAESYARSACLWLDLWRPEFDAIGLEAYVLSRRHGYAGTTDALWSMDLDRADEPALRNTVTGRGLRELREELGKSRARGLNDFKTSNSMAPSFPYQVEAYASAEVLCLCPADGRPAEEHPIGEFDFVSVLHIKPHPDTTDLRVWKRRPETFSAFLGLMDFVDDLLDGEGRKPLRADRISREKAPPVRTTVRPFPADID